MDELNPLDPEFTEQNPLPQEEGTPCHYGTGRLPKPPRSHMTLVVTLLALLVAANLITVLAFLGLRNREATQEVAPTQNPDEISPIVGVEDATQEPQPSVTIAPSVGANVRLSPAAGEALSLQEVYAKVSPSLVGVHAGEAWATGVIFSADGYILVNAYVVEGDELPTVTLGNSREYTAALIGVDSSSDLALMKIDAREELTPAQFGESAEMGVGDSVVAISKPFGVQYDATMSEGILSAITRNVQVSGGEMCIFQTNAALDAENAGGPLVNMYGQVIGMNAQSIGAYTSYESVPGIGFCVPTHEVQSIVDALATYGYVSGRAWIGAAIEELSQTQRLYWNLPEGVILSEVYDGSCAHVAGLRSGDVLVAIGDTAITDVDSCNIALNAYRAGDCVRVYIYRGGAQYYADLLLDDAGKATQYKMILSESD
ncbi:MAG: S1C family serine protease [Oscillospiraceae bacterium]|jgi:serine protease Do|nr:S1C family serine protease [Oscillospiraceae bacterium]